VDAIRNEVPSYFTIAAKTPVLVPSFSRKLAMNQRFSIGAELGGTNLRVAAGKSATRLGYRMNRTTKWSMRVLGIYWLLIISALPVTVTAQKPIHWVGIWAAAPRNLAVPAVDQLMSDTTYRNVIHLTMGGHALRFEVSNEFGAAPLKIDGVHVAISTGKSSINSATDVALTFGGNPSVVIPDGTFVLSDAVSIDAKPFTNLAVSIFVPKQTIRVLTIHPLANATTYKVSGNALSAATLEGSTALYSWYLVKGVEAMADEDAASIVTLGDSITDGRSSTLDTNARWPDDLAIRLQGERKTSRIAVLNEGISGNRILHDFDGPSALSRFDRDVLAQFGVKYLVILEGINDIGQTAIPKFPDQAVTAKDIIFGLMQIVSRAHAHNLKVFGATLTPYEGAAYFSNEGERDRQTINAWIRSSGAFDGVIDFDAAVRDPAHPSRFLPAYDDGHHLHPNDAGYKAMSAVINFQLFQ
jgi:lysophospholipase L1-like esterase